VSQAKDDDKDVGGISLAHDDSSFLKLEPEHDLSIARRSGTKRINVTESTRQIAGAIPRGGSERIA